MKFSFAGIPQDLLAFWGFLHPDPIHGFFLGPVTPHSSVVYMSAGEPRRIWKCDSKKVGGVLKDISARFHPGLGVPRFFGFLGFNAGRSFDPGLARHSLKPHPLGTPAAFFGDYPHVAQIDFKRNQTILFTQGPSQVTTDIKRKVAIFLKRPFAPSRKIPKHGVGQMHVPSLASFSRQVASAKAAISRGDIYQANLSLRFSGPFKGDTVDYYRRLSLNNPSPYSCLIKWGGACMVSASPELLVRVQGRKVAVRPIAGTRPRSKNPRLDKRRRGQLLLSPKERAEHVMLVDLERNDLGRVCVPGSVEVKDQYQVEKYSHVMHIVSQVEGRLARGRSSVDALQAVFPGGTVTGCPKIKAVELIEDIEGVARGPFYGSAGFFFNNGDAVFNILIRTALIQNKKIYVQAGAGIVADSHPKREYREIMAKAAALLEAIKT
ncbi:MAG: Aminodeoxychorismate synthase component 1 [Elusimicrobia bacterium]|nr:Aminodeoxychorismate synthase component 1 [Elusimicrobiota bacterium]